MKSKIQYLGGFILLALTLSAPVMKSEAAVWNFTENAPGFRRGIEWLNVSEPIPLRKVQGKMVLLQFWTASSPECIAQFSDLKQWSEQYADQLVVIGIHAPRFTAERDIQNVRANVLRYDIEYPVANDPDLLIWRDYHVSVWPTLVLIDTTGKIIVKGADKKAIDQIAEILKDYKTRDVNHNKDNIVNKSLEKDKEPVRPLNFPTRIIADQIKDRLFISDSGNHRIIVTDLSGGVLEIIGSGKSGAENGSFEKASFEQPQGMALKEDVLYVADQGNHLIRKIDLNAKSVSVIAGTGVRNTTLSSYGDSTKTDLDTPIDLTIVDDSLYVAMAGSHQIWVLNLKDHRFRVFAGTGQQKISDGPLRMSSLAQPSGLSTDGKTIYFSDSVVSAVRSAEIISDGYVHTIMGYDFFIFGDRDGDRGWTRLQYPNGILYLPDGLLAVADTYNNKIKLIDKTALITSTLSGNGHIGSADGGPETASYNQPQGLGYKQNKIYVADTNNHAIRVIDLQDRKVSTLSLKFPRGKSVDKTPNPPDLKGDRVTILREFSDHIDKIKLRISLPPGHKFLVEGMNHFRIYSADGQVFKSFKIKDLNSNLTVSDTILSSHAYAQVTIYYCREGDKGMCKVKTVLFDIPLKASPEHRDWDLSYTILP